ncbi:MAG TPA: endonuclease III, partial [Spirochaetota bacterium]|nr:endonuclease III [Spirochaetota bacterium]
MDRKTAGKIITKLRDYHGEVVPALEYTNVYELTIAVVLSAQTTDRQVNNVSGELFNRYPDFAALAEAKQRDVEKIIRSTGFYHAKAGNIIRLAKMVTDSFGGKLPGDR